MDPDGSPPAGMTIVTLVFIGLSMLPYNFDYWELGILIFLMGCGNGMFSSPNSSSIMNSVPPQDRGVASGMMFTLTNSASMLSMGVFFTIVIVGIQGAFPGAIHESFASFGSSQITPAVQHLADQLSSMPPTNALFSAFLGYNPMGSISERYGSQYCQRDTETDRDYADKQLLVPTDTAIGFYASVTDYFQNRGCTRWHCRCVVCNEGTTVRA